MRFIVSAVLTVALVGCASKSETVDSDSIDLASDTDKGTAEMQDTDTAEVADTDTGAVETDVPHLCEFDVPVLDSSGYHTITMRNALRIELDPDTPADPVSQQTFEKLRVRFTAVDPDCGDLSLERFIVDVSGTDNAETGWRTFLMYWVTNVYDLTHGDGSTPDMIQNMTGLWYPWDANGEWDGTIHQQYGFGGHILVEAGTTTIVSFTATSSADLSVAHDSFQVVLPAMSIIVSDGETSAMIDHPEIAGNVLHY